jgi:glycosyltransferase involved in cell wall biosynthesis
MAPDDSNGAADFLERERRRARRASADARHAELEALDLRNRLGKLTAELKVERRRYRALRQRRSTRLAVAVSDRLRVLLRRVTGRRRAGKGQQSATTPAPPERPVRRAEADPRSAPRLYREALLASLLDPRGRAHPLRVTLVGHATNGLRSALTSRGYEVRTASAGAASECWPDAGDVTVVTDPGVDAITLPAGVVRVAWTAGAAAEWPAEVVSEYDIVVPTAEDAGRSFVDTVERWARATRVAIRVPPGSARTAARWGDTYLARDLRAALRAAGWPTRMHFHDRWNDPAIGDDDVVIDLLGRYVAENRPGTVRVVWQISHPELASAELYRSYDLVFVASDAFAHLMAEKVPDVTVRTLHQATDPTRFRPTPKGPAHELLYVANWREGRPIVDDLLPTDRRLSVFGRGWTPERLGRVHHVGESIPNDQLGPYYAAASIVLNDHAAGMRREGFLSNRLYDAAAAGALVITDEVDGVAEEFDGGVVVYRDRRQLHELIDRYLANPEEARALGERARRAVLARHTFAHRARTLIAAIEPLLARVESGDRV